MTLRACPFCGSPAMLERNAQGHLYHIQCTGNALVNGRWPNRCGVQPCVESSDKDVVIAAWNKREPDWEWKWSSLVETVSARTDQAKGMK